MPLIIISGYPCSGKTTRTKELKTYFEGRNKIVTIVSDNDAIAKAGFRPNDFYADSQKEKQIRADLKSDAIRQLNKDNTVILDAGNYIKGYRYELYCASKAARTTQCTIFCCCHKDQAWTYNSKRDGVTLEPYSQDIFDALVLRYEEPHGNNRWDSPLFTARPEMDLKFEQIYSALYESKPPPPNQSTQNVCIYYSSLLLRNHLFWYQFVSKIICNTFQFLGIILMLHFKLKSIIQNIQKKKKHCHIMCFK